MLKALLNFLLFSSLYIAVCAVLMVWQTDQILMLQYDQLNYYAFAFFSTICSYNFHWYLTPVTDASARLQWNQRRRKLQIAGCIIGGAGAAWFFLPLKDHWLPVAGAIGLTFLYSAPKLSHFSWLRKIAVGKTLFLTFVWTYVTTLLPAIIAGNGASPDTWLLTAHRFFLIYAICILFDQRDLEEDRAQGIRSLITKLKGPQLERLYYISVLLAAVSAILLAPYIPLFVLFSLLLPVTITAMIKGYAETHTSDYVYYGLLDGLMMLSAVIHLLWVSAGGI